VIEMRATWTVVLLCIASPAQADDVLRILEVRVDRPTVHALGVQVTISDDDDLDAEIRVQVRPAGGVFRDATSLWRVRPERSTLSIPAQFAGSVFDLTPGTDYEIQLHAIDPDGTDEMRSVTARTRDVPRDPASPRIVSVSDADGLRAALSGAMPGDVIELTAGEYVGSFSISASGTEGAPIVIRGDGAILDGAGCTDCNVLEVYGSYVHVEDLTIENAIRALRFQGSGTTLNVARRLTIRDVVHGIGSGTTQTDFYVCDNDIDGRLIWPWVFDADATSHWDDRGIDMNGDGHVICHNRIRGFGDPIVNKTRGSRSWDVYGNDILDCFDGTELDESTGNVRFFGNRWTNVMAPISLQPVFGGPAYVLRNVGLNVPDEQIKMKSLGGTELPSGILIWHNTFVSPEMALNLQTPITQYDFRIENNLFVGPSSPAGNNVEWTAAIEGGVFDYDGYYPDDGYWLGTVGGTRRVYSTLAEAQAAGVEVNGIALTLPIFEDMFIGPDGDGRTRADPASFALAPSSNAIDRGRTIAGINDLHTGGGPDLGAWERGCPAPHYGPRPLGMERELVAHVDCVDGISLMPGQDAGVGVDGGDALDAGRASDASIAPPPDGGCGCRTVSPRRSPYWGLLLLLVLPRSRRRS
jgi:hypothetical protein